MQSSLEEKLQPFCYRRENGLKLNCSAHHLHVDGARNVSGACVYNQRLMNLMEHPASKCFQVSTAAAPAGGNECACVLLPGFAALRPGRACLTLVGSR